jgi:hypothetical protein
MTNRALIVSLLLCILLTACTSPHPTGRIAFSSDGDGDHEIYLMNSDGTGLVRLTDNQAEDKQPSKSPVLQSTVCEWHETQDRGDYQAALSTLRSNSLTLRSP